MLLRIKKKLGNLIRETPVIRDHSWVYEVLGPNDKKRRYLDALNPIDKSERYLDILNQCLNQSNNGTPDFAMLHKSFRHYMVRSNRLPREWWINFMLLAKTTDAEADSLANDMIVFTNNLNPQILSVYEWLALYSLCIRVGLFQIGYFVRNLARIRALNALRSGNKNFREKKLAIAAAIELREFGVARRALSHFKKSGKYKNYCDNVEFILYVNTGASIEKELFKNKKDLDFLCYVNQKNIAVVGPASTEAENAKEIDSFDRIVRINYTKSGIGCDSLYRGLRCDMAYMNFSRANSFFNKTNVLILEELDWIVLKNFKVLETKAIIANSKVKIREKKSNSSFNFNGSFNMVPNTALDLLYFNPKRIKIFHSDFYLTSRNFLGYSPIGFDRDKARYCRAAVSHDPVTQYSVLYNLWQAGRIEGDKRFNEVMELGCEEYMRQLQQIYGDSARLGPADQAAC